MTKAVFICFGARGQCYANYYFTNKTNFKIQAVADAKTHLRELAVNKYGCPKENCFDDWKKLLSKGVMGDILFICTQDNFHVEPAIEAIKAGYKNIMVEKPIDKSIEKCLELKNTADEYGANVQVCHSLRYTNFYRTLKSIIDSGVIGKLQNINHIETAGTFHYAHNFVRGDWARGDLTSPIILAKCCHDTDLLLWLTGKKCKTVSSYGSLDYFKKENAPDNAPERCIWGCPVNDSCPYSAIKYLGKYKDQIIREYAVEKEGFTSTEEALEKGRYGRCVFYCDNNVADHQTSVIEFEDGIVATLTMSAFSNIDRQTHIMGTLGEILADFGNDKIEVFDFKTDSKQTYKIGHAETLHGGADYNIVSDFIKSINNSDILYTDIKHSIDSHIMAMAMEESRITGRPVSVSE